MAHTNTEEKFISAVEIIRNLPKSGPVQPSNDTKLKFYSYFKQATEGPCVAPKPGFWEVVNRAKWDAWNKLGNMSKEEAMKKYVEEFVKTLQQYSLDDLEDPSVINEYSALIAPYMEYVPKEIQENCKLMNGNAKKPLNNNSEDHLEKSVDSTCSNPSKDYKNEYTGKCPDGYPVPLNGHNINGNDSDSDEFSDTLERVNEDESPEATLSVSKPMNNNNPLINAKGPNILNVRGGLDHRVGAGDNNSPAGAPSGSRGNGLSRQPRSSDFSLPGASNSSLIGGAGGNRRSGGDYPTELSSEVGEQLAMAVIRLQHIMEQVVVRLDSLETLLTEKREKDNSLQVSTKKQSRWSFFGIPPKLAIIILAWPFIAQWLMYVIRKRQRQQ